MTGVSFGLAFRVPSLRFENSFSFVSFWPAVSKKTSSYCAMPVESIFTSKGFIGMSSLFLKIISPLGSFSK